MKPRCFRWLRLSAAVLVLPSALSASSIPASSVAKPPAGIASRAQTTPRKVVLASALVDLAGPVPDRLQAAGRMIDDAAREAAAQYGGHGLDLVIFPEFSLRGDQGETAAERAVSLAGPVQEAIGAKAREHRTWIIMPMTLREAGPAGRFSNAAVLFNRSGAVAGIFRKVHPIADEHGVFEGGVTPGDAYPVFDCDFGRLGILICWDMSYEEAWDALGAGGAELVALPTASPQNIRPSAQALRHHFYVVNSAPRDNVTVFDPIGRPVAQRTAAPGMLVQQVDLAYALLHWSETLHEGAAFTARYGARAGYSYSTREDTGVFWSNDPQLPVGTMVRELGLREMDDQVALMEAARRKAEKP